MFPERIETGDLGLEPLSRDRVDLRRIHRHRSTDSETVETELRYLPDEPHETVKETCDWIEDAEQDWADGERATYLARPARGDEIIGTAGLHLRWDRRSGFVAVWLRRPYWGKGYAAAAVDAMVELGFDLGLEVVALSHEPGNDRSKRLIEGYVDRVGGRYDGCLRNWVAHDDHVADLHRYSISEAEYEGPA